MAARRLEQLTLWRADVVFVGLERPFVELLHVAREFAHRLFDEVLGCHARFFDRRSLSSQSSLSRDVLEKPDVDLPRPHRHRQLLDGWY